MLIESMRKGTLSQLPSSLQVLTPAHFAAPSDLGSAVFIRVIEDCGEIDGIALRKGGIVKVPYSRVSDLVEQGSLELL